MGVSSEDGVAGGDGERRRAWMGDAGADTDTRRTTLLLAGLSGGGSGAVSAPGKVASGEVVDSPAGPPGVRQEQGGGAVVRLAVVTTTPTSSNPGRLTPAEKPEVAIGAAPGVIPVMSPVMMAVGTPVGTPVGIPVGIPVGTPVGTPVAAAAARESPAGLHCCSMGTGPALSHLLGARTPDQGQRKQLRTPTRLGRGRGGGRSIT